MIAFLAAWPLITDPWFYVAAVPAIFMMGLAKRGLASGFGPLAVPVLAGSAAVGAAGPDHDRVAAHHARGHGVAEAVGGAGLEGDAPAQRMVRRRGAAQAAPTTTGD